MTGILFHHDNDHFETCGFEEWNKTTKRMGTCGQKAIGIFRKTPLCKSHFDYAITQDKADTKVEPLHRKEGLFRYGKGVRT
jgi:hypothetical protein